MNAQTDLAHRECMDALEGTQAAQESRSRSSGTGHRPSGDTPPAPSGREGNRIGAQAAGDGAVAVGNGEGVMRVLVCGGRFFRDHHQLNSTLTGMRGDVGVLIEGGARGADRLARYWAVANSVPVETFNADWEKYGRAAGMIRNREMLEEGKPELVVAFPGGKGTINMVRLAKASGVPVKAIGWEPVL